MADERRGGRGRLLWAGAIIAAMVVAAFVLIRPALSGDAGSRAGGEPLGDSAGPDATAAGAAVSEAWAASSHADADVHDTTASDLRSATDPDARQKAIALAKDVWAKFDRLPGRTYRTRGAMRSKAVLESALRRANAGAADLAPDDADAVRSFNAAESRRRLPALLGAGEKGAVRGVDATTIVPSSDAEQCTSMAESWIEGDVTRMLLDAGFSEIGCESDGGFTSWRLDGHL